MCLSFFKRKNNEIQNEQPMVDEHDADWRLHARVCLRNNDEQERYSGFDYTGTLISPDGKIFTLKATVDNVGVNAANASLPMSLYYPETAKDPLPVVSSYYYEQNEVMDLMLIRINDLTLRGNGLGTIILGEWFSILPYFAELYGYHIKTIEGTLSEKGDFTPEVAQRLYRRFGVYEYPTGVRVILEQEALETRNKLIWHVERN